MTGGGSYYRSSYTGVGAMLKMPEIAAMVVEQAGIVAKVAEASSPVGDPSTDPHSGAFKSNIEVGIGIGGRKKDRPMGIVRDTGEGALYTELGTSKQEGYHTLRNALYSIGGANIVARARSGKFTRRAFLRTLMGSK